MLSYIKEKLGFKRWPPIMYILVIPFFIIYIPAYLVYLLIMWLLGFWLCDICEQIRSVKDVKHERTIVNNKYATDSSGRFENQCLCDGCFIAEELTK